MTPSDSTGVSRRWTGIAGLVFCALLVAAVTPQAHQGRTSGAPGRVIA